MIDHIEGWTVTVYGEDGVDFPFPHAFHTKGEAIAEAKKYMDALYGEDTDWRVYDNADDAVRLADPNDDLHIYITKFTLITRS